MIGGLVGHGDEEAPRAVLVSGAEEASHEDAIARTPWLPVPGVPLSPEAVDERLRDGVLDPLVEVPYQIKDPILGDALGEGPRLRQEPWG